MCIFLILIDDYFFNNPCKYDYFTITDSDSDSNKTNNTSIIGEVDGEIYSSNTPYKIIFTEKI